MRTVRYILLSIIVSATVALSGAAQSLNAKDWFASVRGIGLVDVMLEKDLDLAIYKSAEGDERLGTIYMGENPDGSYAFEYSNDGFDPLFFDTSHNEESAYTLPMVNLRVLREVDGRYEVVINEETGLNGYFDTGDAITFMSWGDFLMSSAMFTLRYPDAKYEVRNGPGEGYPLVRYTDGTGYERPQRVDGDWVMFRFTKCEGEQWLRWRNGDDNLLKVLPQRVYITRDKME